MRHSFKEKLNIISLIKGGTPLSRLCRYRHIDHHQVRLWLNLYDKLGEDGLRKPVAVHRFKLEEKSRILLEHIEKGVSLRELCLRYGVSRSVIKKWKRRYLSGKPLEKGRSGTNNEQRSTMGRPRKKEPQTEMEKLQMENLMLRAENALLKKVRTLVEEQRTRARLSGRKPSTD